MDGMKIPDWADLRCVECQGKVVRVSLVISDPPRIPIGELCWIQDGPMILGFTTIPCLHFVDAKDWTLTYEIAGPGESLVTFEPHQAVK